MKIEILEFWAAIVLIIAYIVAAMWRRGAGLDATYRHGLMHLSIAFFMMEVVPPVLQMINNERDEPKDQSVILMLLGIIALVVAVLLYLNSLRLLCQWLLGGPRNP